MGPRATLVGGTTVARHDTIDPARQTLLATLILMFAVTSAHPAPLLGFWAVRDVQMRLARLGYAIGQVDGAIGPRTRAAVQRFQQDRGFPAHGDLDRRTLTALDVPAGSASSGSPQNP